MKWLIVLAVISGCKGDPDKCERAVRNYFQLTYWENADAEIAAAVPEKREEVRKDLLAKFEAAVQRDLDMIVSKCTSANNPTMMNCMIKAKTATQARSCTND
jgi:hypothetical protein